MNHSRLVSLTFFSVGLLDKILYEGPESKGLAAGRLNFLKYVPSRRPWADTFNFDGRATVESVDREELTRHRTGEAQLGQSLREVTRDGNKEGFNSLVKEILPDMNDWSIDRIEGQDKIIYITKSGATHALSILGDGYSSVFRLCHTLFRSHVYNSILIDEPELSLHPQAQRRLYGVVQRMARDRQIIVATHSPYFINWADLASGAKLYRIRSSAQGVTQAKELRQSTIQAIKPVADQIKNRKLFDTVAKEVFFADEIVFTEGQEDVHMISAYLAEKGDPEIPFFGYGSGGASVIEYWLDMASDMSLKAVGLFDGDHAATAVILEQKFDQSPNISVLILPRDDIRDKHLRDGVCAMTGSCSEVNQVVKAGYFDRHWRIKQQDEQEFRDFLDVVRSKLV